MDGWLLALVFVPSIAVLFCSERLSQVRRYSDEFYDAGYRLGKLDGRREAFSETYQFGLKRFCDDHDDEDEEE